MNFTKEDINNYADKLLIGLTDDETKLIQEEFEEINKNMDLINRIPNIKEVEPLSFPFEMEITELRNDLNEQEEIEIEKLFQNCDKYEEREIEVPKVVG